MTSTGSGNCILAKDKICIPVHVSASGGGQKNHWVLVVVEPYRHSVKVVFQYACCMRSVT